MALDILRHTPVWVFAVFVALVALGLRLTRARTVTVVPLVLLPVAMAAWSISSLVQGVGVAALTTWALVYALCVAAALALGPRDDVQYSPATRSFAVPGSWLPLALMMIIFFTRYALGVLVAMRPDVTATTVFAVLVGALSGLTSGAFAARALRCGRAAIVSRHLTPAT